MAEPTAELETPVLLLAMPQVLDPFFHKSVVLLLHHGEEGSFGFIVNRPTGIKVAEIAQGMDISWAGDQAVLAFFGGPVQPQLGTVLFDPRTVSLGEAETISEVLPGLGITQDVGDLARLAEKPQGTYRLLLGYAGWGAGQLVEEILRNDWLTAPVRLELIFALEPDEAWQAALESVGVDPATLPAWSTGNGGDVSN